MKIGIIDTDHYFYIYSLVSLFGTGENEIVIYTTPKIHSRCVKDLGDRPDISYVVQKENQSWSSFLMENVKGINGNGFSYFYILPIYHQYKEHYQFVEALTTFNILVVFNINGWVNPSLTSMKYFKQSWYKRKIMKKIPWIAIDEHFHDYAVKRGCRNKILHIPSLLFDPEKHVKRNNVSGPVRFIYPGSIDNRRRRYETVMAVLTRLADQTSDFELVLLGDPMGDYGQSILKQAESINEKAGKQVIKFYRNEYNDAEFVEQITHGDILVTSLIADFELDGVVEIYGVSKSTGSCFDILAYAIPGIFPDWLSINSKFSSSTLRFHDENDLFAIMKDFIDHPEKIQPLRDNAYRNSTYYSIANVRERIRKALPANLNPVTPE